VARSPDYIVEIDGLQPADAAPAATGASRAADSTPGGRPWLAIHWRCCHVYSRVYRNRTGDAYVGGCPACGRRVRARIGPGGMSGRFFSAQ
jgi:hypothetical protein